MNIKGKSIALANTALPTSKGIMMMMMMMMQQNHNLLIV
jgi:hypothetical protein